MLIYDCEIKKAILGKTETAIEGIEYCGGWRDFEGMGISCIGAYDYSAARYRVFCEDNLAEFQALVDDHDIIVGFNSLGFDNPLCAANGLKVPDEKSYDILVQVWLGAGLGPKFAFPTHIGYGLDAICECNFGVKKSGNGALAPVLWQRGEIGAVIDYCLNDVRITKRLLDHIIEAGVIVSPKDGAALNIEKPITVCAP